MSAAGFSRGLPFSAYTRSIAASSSGRHPIP